MQKMNRSLKRGSYTFVSILLVLTMLLSTTAFAVSTFDLSALGATADSAETGAEADVADTGAQADAADTGAEADAADTGAGAEVAQTGDNSTTCKHIMGTITSLNDTTNNDYYYLESVNSSGASIKALRANVTSDTDVSSVGYQNTGTFDCYMLNGEDYDRLKLYRDYNKHSTIEDDSVRIYHLNEDGTKGAEFTDDTFHVYYTPAAKNAYGYAVIDGLGSYDGDLYIEAQSYDRYNSVTFNFVDGAGSTHTGRLQVTDGSGGYHTGYNIFTPAFNSSEKFLTGTSYQLEYNGSTDKKFRMAEMIYPDKNNDDVVETFNADENGVIEIRFPEYLPRQTYGKTIINIYFDDTDYDPINKDNKTYSVTVTANYDAFGEAPDASVYQTVEYYADTSEDAESSKKLTKTDNSVKFYIPVSNSSPTFNVKSSVASRGNTVSVKDITVKDKSGNDITDAAFGDATHKDFFLESTKTAVFGYFELQNISQDITIELTYDEPLNEFKDDTTTDSDKQKIYPFNIITLGDMGQQRKPSGEFTTAPSIYFASRYSSARSYPTSSYVESDSNRGKTYGNNDSYYKFLADGGQFVFYQNNYCNSFIFYTNYYTYIPQIKYYTIDGDDITEYIKEQNRFVEPGKSSKTTTYTSALSTVAAYNAASITAVVTFVKAEYRPLRLEMTSLNNAVDYNARMAAYRDSATLNGLISNTFAAVYDQSVKISGGSATVDRYYFLDGLDTLRVDAYGVVYASDLVENSLKIYKLNRDGSSTGEDVTEAFTKQYTSSTSNPAVSNGYLDVGGFRDADYGVLIKIDAYCRTVMADVNIKAADRSDYTGRVTFAANKYGVAYTSDSGNADSSRKTSYSVAVKNLTSEQTEIKRILTGEATNYTVSYDQNDHNLRVVELIYRDYDETGNIVSKSEAFYPGTDGKIIVYMPGWLPENLSTDPKACSVNIYFDDTDYDPEANYDSAPFSWTTDTSVTGADSTFKPVTKLRGSIGGTTVVDRDVTSSNYNGRFYPVDGDNKVTVTVGGDSTANSAFYNTNLVYTLTNPKTNEPYAKFRVWRDKIIAVDTGETELLKYVSTLSPATETVNNTYGVCEKLTFDLRVPSTGMYVTFTPMLTYIPVEIKQQVVDDNGNVIDTVTVDDGFKTAIAERYYWPSRVPDYFKNRYFITADTDDYFEYLSKDDDAFVTETTATGESTTFWMLVPNYEEYPGFHPTATPKTGYYFTEFAERDVVGLNPDGEPIPTDNNVRYSSGLHYTNQDNKNAVEYGTTGTGQTPYIRSNKVVLTVNYKMEDSTIPFKWTRDKSSTGVSDNWPVTKLYAKYGANATSEGYQDVTRDNLTDSTHTYEIKNETKTDSSAKNPVRVEISGGDNVANDNRNTNYWVNLVFTLKDYTSGKEIGKFRIYNDKIIYINNEAEVKKILDTDSFKITEKDTDKLFADIEFTLNLPRTGLAVDYAVMESYVPITVNQKVNLGDGKTEQIGEDSGFKVTISDYTNDIWYKGNTITDGFTQAIVDNREDMIKNKPFTASGVTDYYDIITTTDTAGCVTSYEVKGAKDSRMMLMPVVTNPKIRITPSCPASYTINSVELVMKNKYGDKAGSFTNYTLKKVGDYYEAELGNRCANNQAVQWEINVEYTLTKGNYANVKWGTTSSTYNANCDPYMNMNGQFLYENNYNSNPYQTIDFLNTTNKDYNGVLRKVAGKFSFDVTIGGYMDRYSSYALVQNAFYNQNLVFTLKDYEGKNTIAQFRIFRGKVEPVGTTTEEDLKEVLSNFKQENLKYEGENAVDLAGGFQKATFTLTVPNESGMFVTWSAEPVYVPIKINQYVLGENGEYVAVADNDFKATVTPHHNDSSDDRSKNRPFTVAGENEDYYSILKDTAITNETPNGKYVSTYDVTGASDSRLMYIYKGYHNNADSGSSNGVVINMSPKDGYMFDHVAYSVTSIGDPDKKLTDFYTSPNNAFLLTDKQKKDNQVEVKTAYWDDLSKNGAWEINLYYVPTTDITIHQLSPVSVDGDFGTVYLDSVTENSEIDTEGRYLYKAKAGSDYSFKQNANIVVGSSAPQDETKMYKETSDVVLVKAGATPRVKITPNGSRKIKSVKFYSDEERKNEITATLGEDNTYTLDTTVKYGDHIYADIVYSAEQHLTVRVYQLDSGNYAQLNQDQDFKVTVSGKTTEEGYAQPFTIATKGDVDQFETHNEIGGVVVAPKTSLTVTTDIAETKSDYIVADVKLKQGANGAVDNSKNVTPDTKKFTENGKEIEGKDYSHCTIDSLSEGSDAIIEVYIAKVSKVNVSVWSADDSGLFGEQKKDKDGNIETDENGDPIYVANGVPHDLVTAGSYVSVSSSNSLNDYAFVTAVGEGNYTTNEFAITYNPAGREIRAVQGTKISVFAQLPENGLYVVSRIESDTGFTSAVVDKVETVEIKGDDGSTKTFMRVNIKTNATITTTTSDYDLRIYIEKAASIKTSSYYVNADGSNGDDYNHGKIRVQGTAGRDGDIPFTLIKPNVANASNDYTISGSYILTSEAKCVAGTKDITFTVTPDNNYRIKEVKIVKGNYVLTANDYTTESVPDSDAKIYKLKEPMDRAYDIEFSVWYEIKSQATVKFRIQYTKDYQSWHQAVEIGQVYVSGWKQTTINAKDSNYIYDLTDPKMPTAKNFNYTTENPGGYADNYSHLTEDGYYTVQIEAGTNFVIGVGSYNNGDWYTPIQNEAKIQTTEGGEWKPSGTWYWNRITYTSWEVSAAAGGANYVLDIKLVPAAQVTFVDAKNNHYGDSPAEVDVENHGYYRSTLYGENNSGVAYTDGGTTFDMKDKVFGVTTSLTNQTSGSQIVTAGSEFTQYTITGYETYIEPGKVVKVQIYEYDKNDNTWQKGQPHDFSSGRNVYDAQITSDKLYDFEITDHVKVEANKQYVVYTEIDNIDVYVYSSSNPASFYLVFTDKAGKDIRIGDSGVEEIPLTSWGYTRMQEAIKEKKGPAYLVAVTDYAKERVYPYDANFRDFNVASKEYTTQPIIDVFKDSYHAVTNDDGSVKYYYYYKIDPSDEQSNSAKGNIPVDNSVWFSFSWRWISDPTPVTPTPDQSATVHLTQYDRVDYNKYETSTSDVCEVFAGGLDQTLVTTVTGSGGFFTGKVGQYMYLRLTPAEGFIPEKMEVSYGNQTYTSNIKNSYTPQLKIIATEMQVKIYYYRPAIKITTTNEANAAKATVTIKDPTKIESKETTIINQNDYSKSTVVDTGSQQLITINPLTYTSTKTNSEVSYEVRSILLGNDRTTMVPIYSEGKILNDNSGGKYEITTSEDGVTTLLLKNITEDQYIFIQMVGEEEVKTAQLIVEQYIEQVDNGEKVIVPCDTVKVDVTATNSDENNTPLWHDSEKVDSGKVGSFTMNPEGEESENRVWTDEAMIDKGSQLWVVPDSETFPEDYSVAEYTATYYSVDGKKAADFQHDNDYKINFGTFGGSPDSGIILVKIVYKTVLTDYTLTYHYNGRADKDVDGDGYYDNEPGEVEKTYTTTVSLKQSQIKDGKPIVGILMDHAPAVTDLYKDCKWVFDDDESHVTYDADKHTVDITAVQDAHKYSVEFKYYGDDGELKTVDVETAALNSLVKKDGKFIEAPAKDGDNDFAFWSVTEKGTEKEIARCYNRAFNLRVTGDIVVTATYQAGVNLVSISDPVFTREQTTDENGNNISDTLYADFILAYMESEGLLLNEQVEKYQTGLIIEQNKNVRLNKEDVEGATVSAEERNTAIALYGAGSELTPDNVKTMLTSENFNYLVTSADNSTRYVFYSVDNSTYNNRNRVNQTLAVANSAAYRQLVMRAYYYVYNTETGEVELSKPVYFYFYDIGNSKSNVSANDSSAATPDQATPAKEGE